MRAALVLVLLLLPVADAQGPGMSVGTVTVTPNPASVVLAPGENTTFRFDVDATIECPASTAPPSPVTVRAEPANRPNPDEVGTFLWHLDKATWSQTWIRQGNFITYNAGFNAQVDLQVASEAPNGTTSISWTGSEFANSAGQCGAAGYQWEVRTPTPFRFEVRRPGPADKPKFGGEPGEEPPTAIESTPPQAWAAASVGAVVLLALVVFLIRGARRH